MTLPAHSVVADSLPQVAILATGGTIAGQSVQATDTTDYQVGGIGVQALIDAVPAITQVARVSGEQVANVDSSNVDWPVLQRLIQAIERQLARPEIHGVVVTHGTDTLADSAFLIDLTVRSSKPVVFVGAMRPATAISADGPMNLLNAVTLAASPSAMNRGTLIALNDRIGSAFYISKTHSTTLDTFRAEEQGFLGLFLAGRPRFYYEPAQPLAKPHFTLDGVLQLPKVSILCTHQDMGPELLNAALTSGAQGLVIEASGNGTLPTSVKARVRALDQQGIPVVRATRTHNGFVSAKSEGLAAGIYTASKARWLLALALAHGWSRERIQQLLLPPA